MHLIIISYITLVVSLFANPSHDPKSVLYGKWYMIEYKDPSKYYLQKKDSKYYDVTLYISDENDSVVTLCGNAFGVDFCGYATVKDDQISRPLLSNWHQSINFFAGYETINDMSTSYKYKTNKDTLSLFCIQRGTKNLMELVYVKQDTRDLSTYTKKYCNVKNCFPLDDYLRPNKR